MGFSKACRSVAYLFTAGRLSTLYTVISSDTIRQETEEEINSGRTTGTADSTAGKTNQDKEIVTVVIKRSSNFFLGRNIYFLGFGVLVWVRVSLSPTVLLCYSVVLRAPW